MAAPKTAIHTWDIREVMATSADSFGVTVKEVRLFLEACYDAEVPESASVYVSGLRELSTDGDGKWYWARRLRCRPTHKEIERDSDA